MERERMDRAMLDDYVTAHEGMRELSPDALRLALLLWAQGFSYAEIAAEIVSQDL